MGVPIIGGADYPMTPALKRVKSFKSGRNIYIHARIICLTILAVLCVMLC